MKVEMKAGEVRLQGALKRTECGVRCMLVVGEFDNARE